MSFLAGGNANGGSESKSKVSTKYFCESTDNEAKICMKLESLGESGVNRLPHCWVLVIDVSASMGEKGKDGMSMIDRVKTFVSLAKKIIPERDYMSLVSFSSSARTELTVTRMDEEGKKKMLDRLNALKTQSATNIEAGLVRGLDEIICAKREGVLTENTTESIIIFTDGNANEGIEEGSALVERYRNIERSIGTNTRIPLSAFTVGNKRPDLLVELSHKLGTEAFYWLDETQDFEADMIMPFELRRLSVINNVQVLMQTRNTALFTDRTEEQLVDHSPTHSKYFVHMLPLGWPKMFQVRLSLPNFSLEKQLGLEILDVTTTFCDVKGNEIELHDIITLTGKSIFEASELSQADRQGTLSLSGNESSEERSMALQKTSSFIYAGNSSVASWQAAKNVILLNAKLEFHRFLLERQPGVPTARADSLATRDQIKERIELIIGNKIDPDYIKWIKEIHAALQDICDAVELASRNEDLGRFASMRSALAKNMPAPRGVFRKNSKLNGAALTQDIGKLLKDAKDSLRHVSKDGSFRTLLDKLEEDQINTRLESVKENFASNYLQDAKNALKPTTETTYKNHLFRGMVFVLSNTLQGRDSYARKITNHHGVFERELAISNANDQQVYVVMESDGATSDSTLFQRATEKQVPIVQSGFIDACVEQKMIVGWYDFAAMSSVRMKLEKMTNTAAGPGGLEQVPDIEA